MSNFKRIILITIFIFSAVGLGYSVYYFFFRPTFLPTNVPETNVNIEQPGVLPGAGTATSTKPGVSTTETPTTTPALPKISDIAAGGETRVRSVVKEVIQEPILNEKTGDILYYNKGKNEFYKIDSSGQKSLLSEKNFYQVQNIIWSSQRDRAILEYPDGNKILYDFTNDKQITLDKNWSDFSFSADGQTIGLKIDSDNSDNRWLAEMNDDGTGLKILESLGDNADKVQVALSPNNQVVAFSATGDAMGYDQQEILFIGAHGENFRSIVVEGRGFEGAWSPQGNRIIYSVWNSDSGYRPTLWTTEAEGDNIGKNRKSLDLGTWVDKCTFSSDNQNVYCAVPRELPEGSGMMPEVVTSGDDFYKINLDTGVKTFLARPDAGTFNVNSIFLSSEENFLYFSDKDSGQLYKIQLK